MSLKEWFNRMKETNPNIERLQEKMKQFVGGQPGVRGPQRGGLFGPPPMGGPGGVPQRNIMSRPQHPPFAGGNWGAFPPGPPPLFGPAPHHLPPPDVPESHHSHAHQRMSGLPNRGREHMSGFHESRERRHTSRFPESRDHRHMGDVHESRERRHTSQFPESHEHQQHMSAFPERQERRHTDQMSPWEAERQMLWQEYSRPPVFPPGPPPFAPDMYRDPPQDHRRERTSGSEEYRSERRLTDSDRSGRHLSDSHRSGRHLSDSRRSTTEVDVDESFEVIPEPAVKRKSKPKPRAAVTHAKRKRSVNRPRRR